MKRWLVDARAEKPELLFINQRNKESISIKKLSLVQTLFLWTISLEFEPNNASNPTTIQFFMEKNETGEAWKFS